MGLLLVLVALLGGKRRALGAAAGAAAEGAITATLAGTRREAGAGAGTRRVLRTLAGHHPVTPRTIPAAWRDVVGPRRPTFLIAPEVAIGLAAGEPTPRFPALAPFERRGGPPTGKNVTRIRAALAAGGQWIPTRGGPPDRWSTWHWGSLDAASEILADWIAGLRPLRPPGQRLPLEDELRYARRTYRAMSEALLAIAHDEIRDGSDPVLQTANAYTSRALRWLAEHDQEILTAILTLSAGGALEVGLGATVSAAAGGAATLDFGAAAAVVGPAAVMVAVAAILAVSVYAFVTGARPGSTLGKGDDVYQFITGGTVDRPVWLRPEDVDRQMHLYFRAVGLAHARRHDSDEGGMVAV